MLPRRRRSRDRGRDLYPQWRDHHHQRGRPVRLPCLASGRSKRTPSRDLYLVTFDLLHLDGHDLRDMPVEDRREILHAMIPTGGRIQFSEAPPGAGDAVYHLACEMNLEGVVSKRKTSVYRSGPTMNCRKIKCFDEKEMDIIRVRVKPASRLWC
nr:MULTISPECIES: hypothetical protein [unclassified Mesorhizobium]